LEEKDERRLRDPEAASSSASTDVSKLRVTGNVGRWKNQKSGGDPSEHKLTLTGTGASTRVHLRPADKSSSPRPAVHLRPADQSSSPRPAGKGAKRPKTASLAASSKGPTPPSIPPPKQPLTPPPSASVPRWAKGEKVTEDAEVPKRPSSHIEIARATVGAAIKRIEDKDRKSKVETAKAAKTTRELAKATPELIKARPEFHKDG